MSPILLVRHARAGDRTEWSGDDRLRPLDGKGRRQATALVDTLAPYGVERILSSPYLRCVQTVEPLAAATGVEIEEREQLAEGATWEEIASVVGEAAAATTVLCTHGDVVIALVGPERPVKKGSTWVLELDRGGVEPVEYLQPPGR